MKMLTGYYQKRKKSKEKIDKKAQERYQNFPEKENKSILAAIQKYF